jgi:hypothetical protein
MNVYVRPSQLGVSEFCPRAAEENELAGISRYAVMSTAWHAKLAGNDTLIGELHPDERKEVASYGTPVDCHAQGPNGLVCDLKWDDAVKEYPVKLYERDTLITEGTADAYWIVQVTPECRWAFVGDNKRNTWTIPDGPDCLQLAAYGHAIASEFSCMGYTPGLWSGVESEWTWGTPVDLTSPEALDLYLRLKRAAKNDHRLKPKGSDGTRHVIGAHCKACYGKARCPEFALLTHDGPVEPTSSENAHQQIMRAAALTRLAEALTDQVKTFSERGGVVKDPVTGKVYLPIEQKGRKTVDVEALQASGVTIPYKQGRPFQKFEWRRP